MKIALAQMNSAVADKLRNVEKANDLIRRAGEQGADIVVLPEFFNVEYFPQYRDYKYLDYAESLTGPTMSAVAEAAKRANVWVIATILEEHKPGFYYDTALLLNRSGEHVGAYRKTHPSAVHSLEKIYFRYGSHFPVFQVEDWPVGIMICYDTSFPEVARSLALRGAELLIAPFASPKRPLWRELHLLRAFENGCFVAACNKVGPEGEWVFGGESLVATPDARLLTVAHDNREAVVFADIDRELVRAWRREYPYFRDRRPDLYTALVTPTENL